MRTLGAVVIGGFLKSVEDRGSLNNVTIAVKEKTKNGDKIYNVSIVDFNKMTSDIPAGTYVTAYCIVYPNNYNDRTFINLSLKSIDYNRNSVKSQEPQGDVNGADLEDEEIPF